MKRFCVSGAVLVSSVVLAVVVGAAIAGAESSAASVIESAIESSSWQDAVRMAAEWVQQEPESADAHFWLALALRTKIESAGKLRALTSVGRYRRALDRAVELDPGHVRARQERIGYRLYAPRIAGGNRDLARREIAALEAIDEIAAQQMRVVLAEVEGDAEARAAAAQRLQELEQGRTDR